MIDIDKWNNVKRAGVAVIAFLSLALSFWLGGMLKPSTVSQKATHIQQEKQATEPENGYVTTELIEEFLVAYYTKKDLGENRNRYKVFMTDTAYQTEVDREEAPATQAYKGYMVDFIYQSSEIYLNTKKNAALVEVSYTSTLLVKPNDYENAARNVKREGMLQIDYVKDGDTYRISNLKEVGLTDLQTLPPGSAGVDIPTVPKD